MDDDGRTALFWAASLGHLSVVRVRTKMNCTLHLHLLFQVLLDNGASKTQTDDAGDTPFNVICDENIGGGPRSDDVEKTLRQLLRP